jgi:asparagine synthase (glutamine-hydrolysing)
MCGICGIITFDNKEVTIDEIELLNSYNSHRGPDGEGSYISLKGNVALGHKRLSILDLSEKGKQPMSYLDKYYITLNGEIYNYKELKSELSEIGYSFKSETDTEVLLACYDAWGESMLHKLNGMWAFAIYSTTDNSIFLSRDRFGVKPLYYYSNHSMFLFSSEVQSIYRYLRSSVEVNSEVLKQIAAGSFLYHGTDKTYIKEIANVKGGYSITIKENEISLSKWYTLPVKEIPNTIDKQAKHLQQLIIDACKIRLRSDVPIATCLSGGVDSGSITSIVTNEKNAESQFIKNNSHKSFCASFPGTPLDERKAAETLAEKINAQLEVITVTAPTIKELEEAMRSCDGPMHSLAFYPIWKLYKFIKEQGITVTLDGQGPDEMLGGYRPLYEALWAAIELQKPWWFYDVYRTYASQGESLQLSSKQFAWKLFYATIKVDYRIIAKKMLRNVGLFQQYKLQTEIPGPFSNSLDNSLYFQFFNSPLPAILNQYDRCSMAHGVECRMPFMDYRIVEFLFSLPPTSKVGKGYTKLVLRKAMKGIVPDSIRLNKVKIGFNAPLVDWFKNEMKEWMLDQMNSDSFQTSPIFNGPEILQKFKVFLNNQNAGWDEAWTFWGSVHISWWLKNAK